MFHRAYPLAGVLALALLAGACSDGPISPSAAPDAAARLDAAPAAPGQPPLISARVKYSDQGAKPATGRSGSATLTARALQGKDGTTQLEVSAGTVDPGAPAPTLAKLQVKQFDTDGDLVRTLNYNRLPGGPAAALAYAGLSPGGTLQVQGNVATGARTGVVTVTETIHLRPDLRASLNAPQAAVVGMPVNILATVTEGNGDVGARADCVLYVDDVESDRASGIWVDAGDAVSCAFTHTFQAAGPAQLRVEAANVAPGDYDPANNAAAGAIQVTAPEPEGSDFSYYAEAEDYLEHSYTTSHGTENLPDYNLVISDRWSQRGTTAIRNTMLNGWMYRAVSLPLTAVELRQETGGAVIHTANFADVSGHEYPGMEDVTCTSRWNGAGAMFYLCTSDHPAYPLTSFQYLVSAVAVTYTGVAHTTYYYTDTGDTYYYYNDDWRSGYTDGLPLYTMGPDVRFSMKLTDGAQTYRAATTVVLPPAETRTWSAYAPTGEFCDTGSWSPTQTWSRCWTHEATTTSRRGWVSYLLD